MHFFLQSTTQEFNSCFELSLNTCTPFRWGVTHHPAYRAPGDIGC